MSIMTRRGLRAAVLVATLVATGAAGSVFDRRGLAATGDVLASFDASSTAGVPHCGVNTGLAYDGENLILSCWYTNTLHLVNATTHASAGSVTFPGLSGIMALAYDAGRDRVWACLNHYTVVALDLSTGATDPDLGSRSTMGCTDGLAYDGSDDTLWTSYDASSSIQHYAVDGTLLSSMNVLPSIGYCGNSGIAVGGPDLFLGNNGCSQIYRAAKDLSTSAHFATLGARVEDMECDDRTFDGVGAMWVQDAYDRVVTAYEIELGLCAFGGGAPAGSAESYAAHVRADGVPLDTGTVGRSAAEIGDEASNAVVAHEVPGALRIEAGATSASSSEAEEGGSEANATAKVTELSLLDGLVTAETVVANATATFDPASEAGTTSSDGSILAGLVVNGEPVAAPVDPNTTIEIPGVATVVLCEEIVDDTDATSIRVNMIHVTSADDATEIVVSSAFAAAGPGSASPDPVEPVDPPLPSPSEVPVPDDLPGLPSAGPSFSNGFEAGDAPSTATGSWEIGAPGGGRAAAHGGTQIAATNVDGFYPNGDRATLTTPPIDLTGYDPEDPSPLNPNAGTTATLSWFQTFSSEGWYDCGFVQISTDDGSTWSHVTPAEGYNATSSTYCGGYSVTGSFSGSGVDPEWTPYGLDLTPYAGNEVLVRFTFGSDSSVVDRGWALDDLALTISEA